MSMNASGESDEVPLVTIEGATTKRDDIGRSGRRERVAAFGTLAAGLALIVMAWGLELDATAPIHLSLWVIVVLVTVAEVTVVHLEHTRGQSFSLREIPLVLGLFYASSPDLIIGTIGEHAFGNRRFEA